MPRKQYSTQALIDWSNMSEDEMKERYGYVEYEPYYKKTKTRRFICSYCGSSVLITDTTVNDNICNKCGGVTNIEPASGKLFNPNEWKVRVEVIDTVTVCFFFKKKVRKTLYV